MASYFFRWGHPRSWEIPSGDFAMRTLRGTLSELTFSKHLAKQLAKTLAKWGTLCKSILGFCK